MSEYITISRQRRSASLALQCCLVYRIKRIILYYKPTTKQTNRIWVVINLIITHLKKITRDYRIGAFAFLFLYRETHGMNNKYLQWLALAEIRPIVNSTDWIYFLHFLFHAKLNLCPNFGYLISLVLFMLLFNIHFPFIHAC